MLVARKRLDRSLRRSEAEIQESATIRQKATYTPDRIARSRIKITAGVFLLVLATEVWFGFKPRLPYDFTDPWVIVGTLAIALGVFTRSWAAGTLIKKKRLACDGPYSLVRHPLYFGSTFMMLGFSLLTGMWWNVLLSLAVAAFCFGYAIWAEEAFLARRFADRWTSYSANTGILFPRRIVGKVFVPWSLKRWLRNREFNALLGSLIGWLGLWAWCCS